MLAAGDQYLQQMGKLVGVIRQNAKSLRQEPPPPQDEIASAYRDVDAALLELFTILGRIELLFGENSPTFEQADEAYDYWQSVVTAVGAWGEGAPGALEFFDATLGDPASGTAIGRFSPAARRDIRRTGFRLIRKYRI
jgi:hypothetical protein